MRNQVTYKETGSRNKNRETRDKRRQIKSGMPSVTMALPTPSDKEKPEREAPGLCATREPSRTKKLPEKMNTS